MEDWTALVAGGAVHVVAEDIAAVHTGYMFGNLVAVKTGDGLVLIDSGSRDTGRQSLAALRSWCADAIHTIIYTHGHIDHTFGVHFYDEEAEVAGRSRPHVIAHRNVLNRFDRYDATHGFNSHVIGRQFSQPGYAFPQPHRRPDEIYDGSLERRIGGVQVQLMHGRGETDDATFVWLPERGVLASGDFVIWAFPNAGNPRKAQRHAADWAAALRKMAALNPDVLIPGLGPAVCARERTQAILGDGAQVLETLVSQTLERMNRGVALDEILRSVKAPEALLAKPYLLPKYDDPEFVVRGIWHCFGGWFDGNAASLKPASAAELAGEIAELSGGAERLAGRAKELADAGSLRLAVHLAELAAAAASDNETVRRKRAHILRMAADRECSLIGKAIYRSFAN